ncbi:MAG: aminotransferase class I/II-fold pyridoxal phosphate-dependent enzyme [Ignavibacteria bacterium]|nr:aminotransferase class I/II-fold pyridoxal phosphate-dependent enzyme [Ignavibacteria bacterium]
MIDLRSDTLTTPTEEMRQAMANAVVGDDVYGEDATINLLQQTVADIFGKERGLFVPSGTMGNQICIAIQTQSADEIIADADAHVFHYENAAAAVIARVQISGIQTTNGEFAMEELERNMRPPAYYYPRVGLITVENTHLRHGGLPLSSDYLRSLRKFADARNIPIHCDGARMWNALEESDVTSVEMGAFFDTISVCLSKGLGAPVGSVIVGTSQNMDKALRVRKMLGGGMRQAGILAAAGLYGLQHIRPLLTTDHANARQFAVGLSGINGVAIDLDRVKTNIVMFSVRGLPDDVLLAKMLENGVRLAPIKPGVMRAVFYHQISSEQCAAAVEGIRKSVES